ncbi:eukaryotic translation initiation factor 4 gamma 3 isoform X8, partial [Silurus asotus]
DKPELALQQSDFDLEPVSTTVENSSVSPVIVEHLTSAETPADEIEAQEAEPPKNEPEPGSEDKSNNGVLLPVEEPKITTMHKPEMENKRIQYSRDFLLSIQFLPDCMQKPEGLPSIPGCRYYLNTVVLMLCVAQELFRTVRGFLNTLRAEMFNQLMKQVKELHIDTEERLKGVVELIFEKAIDEPNFSVGYGIMCKSLAA